MGGAADSWAAGRLKSLASSGAGLLECYAHLMHTWV